MNGHTLHHQQEETQRIEGANDDWRFEPPYDLPEGFVAELGCTVRTCIDCGCLVSGGPTRCNRCAKEFKPKPPIAQAGKDEGHTACEKHYSCEGCAKDLTNRTGKMHADHTCFLGCTSNSPYDKPNEAYERTRYTPHPPKGEDAQTDKFSDVVEACFALGMKTNGIQIDPEDVIAFIRSLHRRAGEERYSVERIAHWIFMSQNIFILDEEPECCLIESLNDPQDGIKAVTNRRRTK